MTEASSARETATWRPIGRSSKPTSSTFVRSAPVATSLLGMSFLARLDGYEVRDGRLVLRW